ncbi:MAG: tetratricopeptide repeat protein [Spirochaetaceae bacterium]|jgi:tetratricopeptide (TPR) repeat protein|nr:tetratricopeptide repeat protein [Spirochaetaceae bacterium]
MPSLKQLKQFQSLMKKIGKENEIRAREQLPADDFSLPDHEPGPVSPRKARKTQPDADISVPAGASSAPPPPPLPEENEANKALLRGLGTADNEDDFPNNEKNGDKETDEDQKDAQGGGEAGGETSDTDDGSDNADSDFGFDFSDFLNSMPDDTENKAENDSDSDENQTEHEEAVSGKAAEEDAPHGIVQDELHTPESFDDEFNTPFEEQAADSLKGNPETPAEKADEKEKIEEDPGSGGDFDLDFSDLNIDLAASENDDIDPPEDELAPPENEDHDQKNILDDKFFTGMEDLEEEAADKAGQELQKTTQESPAQPPAGNGYIPPDLNVGVSEEEMNSLFSDIVHDEEIATEPEIQTLVQDNDIFEQEDEIKSEDDHRDSAFDHFDLGGGTSNLDNLPDIETLGIRLPDENAEAEMVPISEINLSEEDVQALLKTLAKYPLNIRIACEEAIGEDNFPPAQLKPLIELLIDGGSAQETARLLGKLLKKRVSVPKGFKTGEELEEERRSFNYIFIHRFLPVARLALILAVLALSIAYLSYQFIYRPLNAENLYEKGYELILSGEAPNYVRANQYFSDAFEIHKVKDWFYAYAERFRDERQYVYAEQKYDQLLRIYPHDKKGALDYAGMEGFYLQNYEKADKIIRQEILDYSVDDKDGLLALGDINLDWGETDSSRYEEARAAYARILSIYGYTDPVLERMLRYFILTDKLVDVLPLQKKFMADKKSKVSASTFAELGGYLLDKRFELPQGVPDENIARIEGIKDVLLRAEKTDPNLPEAHYQLARYYHFYDFPLEERIALENASSAFDQARLETRKRSGYRIDTQRRLSQLMLKEHEFISAENALVKGVNLYEDAVSRRLLTRNPEYGRLYADLGDIEYFAKTGDMKKAEQYYLDSEANGWIPPEIEYRLGAVYYRQSEFPKAFQRLFNVSKEIPPNRKLLNTLGLTSFLNSDFFASQAYYQRLLAMLHRDRDRIPLVLPDNVPEHRALLERIMIAENNMGVTLNALAKQTGKNSYRVSALAMFSEAARVWDALGRDQKTMIRPGRLDPALPGASLPYLNIRNTLYPTDSEQNQMFMRLDADVLEPSEWEERMASIYSYEQAKLREAAGS